MRFASFGTNRHSFGPRNESRISEYVNSFGHVDGSESLPSCFHLTLPLETRAAPSASLRPERGVCVML